MVSSVKRKPIKVTLSDGVEREIKFTLNSMAILEEKFGSVDEAFKKLESGSILAIRSMLHAAIVTDDEKELTEKEVGTLIDMSTLGSIMEALTKATNQDMPESEEEAKPIVVQGEVISSPNK